jgi:hypothetical protein
VIRDFTAASRIFASFQPFFKPRRNAFSFRFVTASQDSAQDSANADGKG